MSISSIPSSAASVASYQASPVAKAGGDRDGDGDNDAMESAAAKRQESPSPSLDPAKGNSVNLFA